MAKLNPSDPSFIEQGVPKDVSKLLTRIWTNPSRVGSFGGVKLLQEQANIIRAKNNESPISERTTATWMSGQEAAVTHKIVRTRNFPRNPVEYSNRVLSQVQADVIFFTDIPQYGYKYMLLFQDTPSRYAIYRLMRAKTAAETLAKLKSIFESLPRIPDSILTDAGSEFMAAPVQAYFKEVDCKHFVVGGGDSGKTPHLDNLTRNIQRRVHKWFAYKETRNWPKVIPQIISSQNRTRNRMTGKTPKEIWDAGYAPPIPEREPTKEKPKFKIGQWVSILGSQLGSLSHQYKGEWTFAKFRIVDIDISKPVRIMYYLEDELGERIKNGFYSNELTAATFPDSKRIEKIIKRKTIDGVKWVLVRYKSRDKRFDSWLKATQVTAIPKVTIKHGKLKR
jgi:hypothetical protein